MMLSDRPVTYSVDIDNTLDSLDYREMLALAAMFDRWAMNEERIDAEQRTKLIRWSSDYEAIAAYAGPDWVARNPEDPPDALVFMARSELKANQNDDGGQEPMPANKITI